MSIIYQVEADLDVVVMEVERGQHPGLSIHHNPQGGLWPIAITDGTSYLWPEGKHMALTWGTNIGSSILKRLGVGYRILD